LNTACPLISYHQYPSYVINCHHWSPTTRHFQLLSPRHSPSAITSRSLSTTTPTTNVATTITPHHHNFHVCLVSPRSPRPAGHWFGSWGGGGVAVEGPLATPRLVICPVIPSLVGFVITLGATPRTSSSSLRLSVHVQLMPAMSSAAAWPTAFVMSSSPIINNYAQSLVGHHWSSLSLVTPTTSCLPSPTTLPVSPHTNGSTYRRSVREEVRKSARRVRRPTSLEATCLVYV